MESGIGGTVLMGGYSMDIDGSLGKDNESSSDIIVSKIKRLIVVLNKYSNAQIYSSAFAELLDNIIKESVSEDDIETKINKLKNPVERRLENI